MYRNKTGPNRKEPQKMNNEIENISKIEGLAWTPVRTKPRQEKKLADYCKSHGVPFYLPMKKSVKRYQRRTVEFQVPMFPGYIFCAVDEHSYQTLLVSGAIVYRIKMDENKEDRLIADLNDLKEFERIVREAEVVIRPEIVEGVAIKVSKGPLAGLSGVVTKRDKKMLITVNVEILGQSASAVIDIEDVEVED